MTEIQPPHSIGYWLDLFRDAQQPNALVSPELREHHPDVVTELNRFIQAARDVVPNLSDRGAHVMGVRGLLPHPSFSGPVFGLDFHSPMTFKFEGPDHTGVYSWELKNGVSIKRFNSAWTLENGELRLVTRTLQLGQNYHFEVFTSEAIYASTVLLCEGKWEILSHELAPHTEPRSIFR